MASLPSISSHSSSLYPCFQSSPLIFSSKTTRNHSSPFFTVRSNGSSRRRLSSSTVPRGLKVLNAATKPAKSPVSSFSYPSLERLAEEDWKTKREVLLQNKVRKAEFKEVHPSGAINVQVYRLIKEWTAWDIARRAAFAFFGIFAGTEENPEFLQTVESKINKNSKIIVACSAGGTMRPSQNLPEGQQSRSLIAAYLLVLNGYKNVFHLEGGLYTWFKEGLPAESEE
ncbi:RHODANESE-LIKE DOMAIN-CONTAINING PROTEIN 14 CHLOROPLASTIC [Salix koriyanagi]|uniref:RHODANESE-LIKE DOMAIN-CONTAINING PROTEIN 14 CHLOROPLASTIC n=1 Tax=Salix koriyanagi TaxID=2511006 RepID=A0A9Q1AB81_9ROSI|nr:RHODANESE-LIKE DOMAIN-CONTAINING PROTEIN 14 CHLOROPLASTIC [Salix koriyanagi]